MLYGFDPQHRIKLGVVVQPCSLSMQEVAAGPEAQDHLQVHNEFEDSLN